MRREARCRSLEEWTSGRGNGPLLVELVGFLLRDGVAEAVAELLGGEGHRLVFVGRGLEHGQRGVQRGEREAQHTLDLGGVDTDGSRTLAHPQQLLSDHAAKGMPNENGRGGQLFDNGSVVVSYIV